MNNLVLSIGCDIYDDLKVDNLSGAENDSTLIFKNLLESKESIYNKNDSILLKSPTLDEVRTGLENVLYTSDILTLFFAGHGGVIDGTYYLIVKNTNLERIAFSALSLSELFRLISSSNVKHLNLIIDACNTAGLVNDLMTVIKPDIIGKKGSLSISILAASATDEYAIEENGHGLFTGVLSEFINGSLKVTSDIEYLDLVIIGNAISNKFLELGKEQTPSSWGLNVYGFSLFVKNIFFNSSDVISVHDFSYIPNMSDLGDILQPYKYDIWEFYNSLDKIADYTSLLKLLQKIFKEISLENKLLFIKGVGYRFIERVDNLSVKKLEILNVFISLLLPYLEEEKIKKEFDNLIEFYKIYGEDSLDYINKNLDINKNYLIDKSSIHSNFYFLPINISKLLALYSQLILVELSLIKKFIEFIEKIKSLYFKNLIIINDMQGTYLYIFFNICKKIGLIDIVSDIFEQYIIDLSKNYGNIASIDISGNDIFKYLVQRFNSKKVESQLTAIPSITIIALILLSKSYNKNDFFDLNMYVFDKKNFNFFIPTNISNFSDLLIEKGMNRILQCGLHFWTVDDIEEIFYSTTDAVDDNLKLEISCFSNAYIQPNKIPYFRIEKK